jgi:hypothetical protein
MKRLPLVLAATALLAASTVVFGQPSKAETITPIRAAFYYPWFPETEHWSTQYHPSLGKYDSSNPTILAAHVAAAKYAGLDAFISSWWGSGTATDKRLPAVLDAADAQGFKVTPYYELDKTRTDAQLAADADRLKTLSASPAWLRVGGKPVLFLYNVGADANCAAVARYKAAVPDFYINAKVFANYKTCPTQPDSWHQYGPASPYDRQGTYSATVSPGFFKFNETTPRLPRDVNRFATDLGRAKASGAQWQLITTFSEWGEGTSVEPATEWQSPSGYGTYLDTIRFVFTGQGPSPSPSPTATATATLSPSPSEASTTLPPSPTATVFTPTPSPSETSATPSETPSDTPTTTPPAGDPVIAAVGDIACSPGSAVGTNCRHKAVSDKILADTELKNVLLLGDNQYESGTLAAYQQSYDPTFGRFKAITKPVPGNHEYNTPNATGYYDYFGDLAGDRTKGYYSYDIGAWHFVALNSEKDISPTGAQVAWLKADLAAHPNKCVAAHWHKPRWSTGAQHGDNTAMGVFVQALYDANADLIMVGHDHDYERFQPLNPAGQLDDARGLVEIVSGEGGRSHYGVAGRLTTAVKDNTSYGYSRLTLHPDSADITFVPAVGTFTDNYRLTCH